MKQTFNYIYQYKNSAIVILKIKKKLPTYICLPGSKNYSNLRALIEAAYWKDYNSIYRNIQTSLYKITETDCSTT